MYTTAAKDIESHIIEMPHTALDMDEYRKNQSFKQLLKGSFLFCALLVTAVVCCFTLTYVIDGGVNRTLTSLTAEGDEFETAEQRFDREQREAESAEARFFREQRAAKTAAESAAEIERDLREAMQKNATTFVQQLRNDADRAASPATVLCYKFKINAADGNIEQTLIQQPEAWYQDPYPEKQTPSNAVKLPQDITADNLKGALEAGGFTLSADNYYADGPDCSYP